MQIALAIVAPITLVLGINYFMVEHRWKKWFLSAYFFKVIMGLAMGFLYLHYYNGGDMFTFHKDSCYIQSLIAADPKVLWTIWGKLYGHPLPELQAPNVRSASFSAFLALLNFATGQNFWVNILWLSTLGFMATVAMCQAIYRTYRLPVISFWPFFFLPSTIGWTSVLLKENILWTAICGCILASLNLSQPRSLAQKLGYLLLLLCSFLVIWRIKYYYSAVLLVAILIFFLMQIPLPYDKKIKKFKLLFWVLSCLALGLAASYTHYNLEPQRIADILVENYLKMLRVNGGELMFIQLDNFSPNLWDLLKHAPQAIWEGLFRPYLWEARTFTSIVASIENTLLLLLFCTSLFLLAKHKTYRPEPTPELLAIVLYIFVLAWLLPIASPVLGSLNRYRSGFLPFLVFLASVPIAIRLEKNRSKVSV